MPLYEYACSQCDSEFELLIRGGEAPTCPTCGGVKLEKLLSVPAAHLAAGQDLPICRTPEAGMCGLPQCQTGGCQMQ